MSIPWTIFEQDDLVGFRGWLNRFPGSYQYHFHRAHGFNAYKIMEELILVYDVDINSKDQSLYVHDFKTYLGASCMFYKWFRNQSEFRVILFLCRHGARNVCRPSCEENATIDTTIQPIMNMLVLVRVDKYSKDIWRTLKSYFY